MEELDLKREYFLEGNKKGCLLIHGFTGTPAELRELGTRLHDEGYSVLGVRLKGHGTSVEEMEMCTYADWIDSAVDGYRKLREICDEIYVIGHSMGSLLALYIAENYDIDKVAALSPPLVIKNKAAKYAFIVKYLQRYKEWKGTPKPRPEEEKKYLLGYGKIPIRSVHEFNKLNSKVKRDLKKVRKPLLIVHSYMDETVENESVDMLYRGVESEIKECVYLERSGHIITVEGEKEKVFKSVIDFLK